MRIGAFPVCSSLVEGQVAVNTGQNSRKGAVKKRSQTKNPKTDEFVKRNRDHQSPDDGEFMDVKEDKKKFKGVAKEPDKRRKT